MSISTYAQTQPAEETFYITRTIPKSETLVELLLLQDTLPAVITSYGESLLMHVFDQREVSNDKPPLLVYSNSDREIVAYEIKGEGVILLSKPKQESEINHLDKEYTIAFLSLERNSVKEKENVHFDLSRGEINRNKNPLFFKLSPQGNYTLICQQAGFQKDQKAIVNLYVHHSDTHMIFHLPTAFDSDDLQLLGASIDERGIIYFAAKSGVKLNSPFQKKHLVYSFDPFEKVLTEFDLSSSDFFIQDMIITTLDSGFNIAMLYSSDPLIEGKSNGYSYIASSDDGREINKRLGGSFTNEMLLAQWGEDSESDGYISDLFLERTTALSGVEFVVMERRYHDQICNADPSTGIMTCTDQYHYNGVTFENPLNPARSATIQKRQLDYDKPSVYTSHSIFKRDSTIWMLYNDHFKNEGLSSDKIMNNPSRSVIKYIRVQRNGELDYGLISEERQNSFIFTPKPGIAISNDRLYFLQKDGDQHRIGRISFSSLNKGFKGKK